MSKSKQQKPIITAKQVVAIQNGITGEMDNAVVTVTVKRDIPKYKGEPFTLLFQASSRAITRNIKPATAKLLLYLCSIVEYNNIIPQGTKEMARDLGYSVRQIERALNELISFNIVIKNKHPKDNRITLYYINPFQSWKGEKKDRSKKIEETNPNQLKLPFPINNEEAKQPKKLPISKEFSE